MALAGERREGGPMETIATETNAFMDWFQTWGQVGYVGIQVAYWVIVAWAAVYAARQAKRFVDFKLGVVPKAKAAKAGVAVDQFVD
jgi:hypothetical protein